MDRLAKETRVITSFDYDALETEQRIVVQQRTGEIRERLRRSAQDIWEIGQKLADVRSRFRHGQFDAWLKAEFDWSRRTAYNFINVYETFRESTNLAQIDIATSALYLLSAPSTSQDIRDEYLQRAREGEKVTHQDLQKTLKAEESRPASAVFSTQPPKLVTSKPEIITVIPKATAEVPVAEAQAPLQYSASPLKAFTDSIQSGWYYLGQQHFLFCGDTASAQFSEQIPQAALAVAITSNDWDHDWLIDRARSVLIFPETALEEKLVEQLLLMFSRSGEIVVFPWLPSNNLITTAHNLGRQVFAGDLMPERCRAAIAHAGLTVEPVSL